MGVVTNRDGAWVRVVAGGSSSGHDGVVTFGSIAPGVGGGIRGSGTGNSTGSVQLDCDSGSVRLGQRAWVAVPLRCRGAKGGGCDWVRGSDPSGDVCGGNASGYTQ